jgi:hypothetical protein
MMKAADLGDRDDATPGRRLDVAGKGGLAVQGEVRIA